jgi:hypothetical protein
MARPPQKQGGSPSPDQGPLIVRHLQSPDKWRMKLTELQSVAGVLTSGPVGTVRYNVPFPVGRTLRIA